MIAPAEMPTDLDLHEWTVWTVVRDGGTFSATQVRDEITRRATAATGKQRVPMNLEACGKALRSLVRRDLVTMAGQFAYRRREEGDPG